jgi:predicted phage terminase large subunit-like protein
VKATAEVYDSRGLVSREDLSTFLGIEREKKRRRARRSLLDFTRFTKPDYDVGWFHESLCRVLDKFAAGEIKRLMVMAPPRHGKSELVSRRLPAYILGKNPDASIIAASYSKDLSSRMNRDVQRIIESPEYHELFPRTALYGKAIRSVANGAWLRNSEIFEVVGHRGVYRSAGIGGGITGMGADFAIIDDPIKDQKQADSPTYRQSVWDWYCSTLYTRLAKGGKGAVLITLTRWHEDDIAGRLLDLAKNDPNADQWVVIRYEAVKETEDGQALDDPRKMGEALWPSGYDEVALKRIKASVGSRVWNALYQQRPTAMAGAMIKRSWLKFWRELPARFDRMLTSWDMSFKGSEGADRVVGQAWGQKGADKYLLDRVCDVMDFPTAVKAFEAFAAKHADIHEHLVEDKANGPAVIATLKNKISGIIPIEPHGSKVARLAGVSPDHEAGNVHYPDPSIAPWVNDHMNEMTNFPKWPKDDSVDAESQALDRFRSGGSGSFTKEMAKPGRGTIAGSRKGRDRW